MTVMVSDGALTASESFTLTVNAVNDNPTVAAALPDLNQQQDFGTLAIALGSVFTDEENDTLAYSVTVGGVINASVTGTTLTLASIAGTNGTAIVTVTATETDTPEKLHVSDTFTVTLKPVRNTSQNTFSDTIQAAINVAGEGDTISVAAGTYAENLTLGRRMTLTGAGAEVGGTLLQANSHAITISGSGVSAAQQMVIMGFRVTSTGGSGVNFGDGVQYIRIEDCTFANLFGVGLRAGSAADIAHLQLVGLTFVGNKQDVYFSNETLANNSDADDILFERCAFTGYQKGIYVEKLSNSVIRNCTFTGAGNDASYAWGAAIDINLKWDNFANILIENCIFTGCGIGSREGMAVGIKARGTGTDTSYAGNPATLTTVIVQDCTITGCERGIRIGEPGKSNTGPNNVTITNNVFDGNVHTYAGTDGSAYGDVVNSVTSTLAADGNYWGESTPNIAERVAGDVQVDNYYAAYNAGTGVLNELKYLTVYVDGSLVTADDTNFKTLAAAAAAVAPGGIIHVAAGTYEESFTLAKPVSIVGPESGYKPLFVGMITATHTTGWSTSIENIDFKVNATDKNNLKLVGLKNLTVKGCDFDADDRFMEFPQVVAVQLDGACQNITFDACTFRDGYYVTIQGRAQNLFVKDSTIENCKSGINIQYATGTGLTLENTDISVVAQGAANDTYCLRFGSATGTAQHMSITGGTFIVDEASLTPDAGTYFHAIIVREAATGTLAVTGTTIRGEIINLSNTLLNGIENHYYVVYVDETYTTETSGWGQYAFASIQDALNAVEVSGKVSVASGTYTQSVTINKPLDLVASGAATIIGTASDAVTIASDGVKIAGFTIQNPSGLHGIYAKNRNQLVLVGNTIENIGTALPAPAASVCGVMVWCTSTAVDTVVISDNTIQSVENKSANKSAQGIWIGDSTGTADLTGLVIQRNTISDVTSNWGAYGIMLAHARLPAHTGRIVNAQIVDNTIKELTGGWVHAIGLEGNTPGATVNNNVITNLVDIDSPETPHAIGIMVQDNPDSQTLVFTQNSFLGIPYGIYNATANPVTVNGNYWGIAEPQIDAMIGGNVVIESFYTDSALTALAFWTVYVDAALAVEENNYFKKIQDGINAVAKYSNVFVAAGTYNENVSVGKTLNLVGADQASTTINGSNSGKVILVTANNVSVSGFKVTGSGSTPLADAGVILYGVTGCTVKDCIVSDNAGVGIGLQGANANMILDNTLNNNTIAGIGLIGASNNAISNNIASATKQMGGMFGYGIVLDGIDTTGGNHPNLFSTGNNIGGNTCSLNQGDGIYLGWNCSANTIADNTLASNGNDGLYIWKADGNTITSNTITDNVAEGIQLMASADNTITGNTITGSAIGLWIRSGWTQYEPHTAGHEALSSGNSIVQNTLAGNTQGLVLEDNADYTADDVGLVDASANWWGTEFGPSGAGFFGTGDAIVGAVDIASYYTDSPLATLHYYDLYVDLSFGSEQLDVNHFNTIQAAYAAANPGDTIHIANGEYTLSPTFTVAKQGLTITGESRAGVIIDASARTGTAYGILVSANDVTLEGFTLTPAGHANAGFPIHLSNTPNILVNITLRDITITGAYRTPFDCNGVDNLTLDGLVANGTVYGSGIGLTGCSNVLIAGCTTTGNAWGGVRVGASPANQANRPSSNVNVDFANNTFNEVQALYVEDTTSSVTATNYSYRLVTNAGITTYLEQGYTEAQAIALALQSEVTFPGLTVTGLYDAGNNQVAFAGDTSTAVVYVDDDWAGTTAGNGVEKPGAPGTYLQFGRNAFATIQGGVTGVDDSGTVNVLAGTYNERIFVNKANLNVQGAGVDSIVTGTTAAPGSGVMPSVFKIAANGVTVKGFKILVDLTFNHSAVHTSGTCTDITVSDNTIVASASAAPAFGYGLRNAIAVNPNITVVGYTHNNVGYAGVSVTGNTIEGTGEILFRAGIQMDLCAGTISGNTITSINHDFISRFANQGDITVSDNQFLGGGAQVGSFNGGAGTVTITNNVFDSAIMQPATGALGTGAALRLIYYAEVGSLNNAVIVSGNTFRNHRWAVSTENFKNATFDNNTFTPKAGATDFVHMTFNTKVIGSTSAYPTLNMFAVGGTLIRNTFNGSGAAGGTALAFYNHRSTDAVFGSYTVGTPGSENAFKAGISTFIELDGSTGPSSDWTRFGGYGSTPMTTMAPWISSLDATNNKFDIGTGLQLASGMSLADLLAVEDMVTHKLDDAALGFVRVKADNVYVTTNSGSIQRGIDAAAADDTVNVAAGTFSVGANVTKSLTLLGANAGIDGSGTRGAESVIDGNDAVSPTDIAFKVYQPNLTVVIDGFMMTDCAPLDENFEGTAPHTTDITFKNNLVSSATAIQCGNGGNTCWRNVTVTNNKFMDINMEANSSAIVLNGCDLATVTDNVFLRMAYNAVQLNGVSAAVVSRNSIDTTQEQAIQLSGVVASGLISDNVILNANVLAKADKGGIRLYGSQFTGPVEITGNIISGSYNGIAIKSGENITGKQITISNNNLEGNSNAGIYHGGTGELSAERNWWGSTTGPVNGTNPGGSGAIVSDNVDFSPWLGDGTDTDLAAIGFQPDLTTVYYKPALLVFAQQPGGAALGMALNPQPTVKVLDDNGQIATQFVGTVSLSISSNPGFGQLGGTIDMLATAGVVSFNNVSIANDGGAGYKLKATVGNLTVESDAFTISNPNPVLSSMDPIFIAKGSAAFTLTVSGSDFVPSSTVMWNGSSRATTYLSASQLTAAITAADVATAGTAQISVASPTATTSGELTFTITETALAPVVYVNGTWSGPADCGTERVWEYDAFRTIQSGVNGVMANGTVNVLAGTYTETVAVSKIIDILGEIDVTGAALPSILGTIFVDVPTTPDAASRIENLKFTVTADDCLKLKSVDGGVTVKNCTFDGAGKFMSGGKVGINFITGGNGNKNIAILGCQFINGLYVSVQGRVDGLTVRNSEFINVKSGLNIPYIGNVVVEDCDISVIAQGVDNDTYGIRFATTGALNASNMRLAGCRINVDKNALVAGAGTYHSAIIVRSGAGGTLAVVNCSIDGEVVNESATVLDASGNWWGSVLPADVKMAANNGALVDYSPWLAVGTDSDEGAVGFKGDFAALWVDDDSPQVGMIGRIQEGVYLTTDAGTVKVAAGIYLESNIVVAKGVTVEGAGSTRSDVLIAPAAEDGNADNAFANNAQNGFIIKAHNVTIRNLTLHGQGNAELTAAKNNFRSGIVTADASYPGGGGTWNNLHVDNVHILYPYRRGISVWPAQVSGTLIENSRIEQVGLNHGISMAGQGQVLNNTIVRAFQGIVVGPDASTPAGLVKINGNTLSEIGNYPGCWGYNAGTGVYSGQPRAIQFNNSDSAGRPVEILNNIITDNGLEAYSGTVGIYTRLANSDSFVEGNIITLSSGVSWAEPGSQSVGMLLGWSYANGFTVRGNRVNSTKYGIGMMVFGNGTAEKPLHIECNELTSTASAALDTGDGTGIYIANQYLFASDKSPTYVNLSSNIVSGYVTAISVEKISTSDKTLTVVASYNDLSGNTKGISSTGGADIVTDAMLNWWGSAQGPAHGSNPGGNGVIVTDSIDFSPWLGDGEDTSTDIGFQPNLAPVYYLPVGLEFTVQPADAFLGAALSQVEVTVKNAIGEIATQFNGSIALAIGTNPGEPVAGELAGTKSVVVQSGVATFADLAIIKGTGNGYTLKASTAELPTATSADFNIENSTPVLTDVADWTTDEQSAPSTFTAQATDTAADLVAQTLTFSLVCTSESAMPEGISFNTATGAFSWQTIESQGGKSYTFTLTVTDNGSGALYAADTFTVTVNEVNAAPTLLLDPTGNEKTIDEEQTLTFTAVGADQDEPTQTLTYTLAAVDGENYPAGATLGLLDGAFSWTPGEEQGGATYVVDVVVTDNGKNPDNLSATQRVTIEVAEVNVAPVLESVLPQSVNFGDTLTFTASATDQDLPAQTLTFSMTGAPAGATLDSSSGAFSWTPTEAQAQASYSFELTVTDSGTNPDNLFDTKTVTIGAVAAMQSCPGFRSPSDSMVVSNSLSVGALTSLTWTPVLPEDWTVNAVDTLDNGVASVSEGVIVYTEMPASPASFTYTVSVPGNAGVSNSLSAVVSFNGLTAEVAAMPIYRYHSADYRRDTGGEFAGQFRKIDSAEVNRVLAYWRAGGYKPDSAGADGFTAAAGYVGTGGHHSADHNNNWVVDTDEAAIVQEYWRAGGYHVDPNGEDGSYASTREGSGPSPLNTLSMLAMAMEPTVSLSELTTYNPGQSLTLTTTFQNNTSAKLLRFIWRLHVPDGWKVTGISGDGSPELDLTGTNVLLNAPVLPTSQIKLVLTVSVPLNETRPCCVGSTASYKFEGMSKIASLAASNDGVAIIPLDSNGNGLADSWATTYGITDPSDDADSDGMSNLAEYLCGTIPTDAASYLRMVNVKPLPGTGVEVSWSSEMGRTYILQRAQGKPADFTEFKTGLVADPSGLNSYVDESGLEVPSFYRVKLQQ